MKYAFKLLAAGMVSFGLHFPLHAQVTFTLVSSPAVGGFPVSVTSADINQDGEVDLICANYGSNTLSVLTNNGSGGFTNSGTYAVGGNPISVTAADMNGDGRMDLICANYGSNTLSVLTNSRSSRFVTAGTYTVGSRPRSVTTADVNGDAKVDIICANYSSPAGTLSVLTNKGKAAFATAGTWPVGANPISIEAADVNGDGRMDLICANSGDSTLSVLTNDGSGGFATGASYPVSGIPYSVTAADANNDGKVDIICANYTSFASILSVLTNDGSGGFDLASSPGVGALPRSVTAADVNGDGMTDLICANYNDNTLSVLLNVGNGNFVTAGTCPVGHGPYSVTAADVNGDGKPDLISANSASNTLSVLNNTSMFPPPELTVKHSGAGIVVSWPSSWWSWALQQNANPAATNWSASSGITDDGTNKNLTVPSPAGNLFFRLSHP